MRSTRAHAACACLRRRRLAFLVDATAGSPGGLGVSWWCLIACVPFRCLYFPLWRPLIELASAALRSLTARVACASSGCSRRRRRPSALLVRPPARTWGQLEAVLAVLVSVSFLLVSFSFSARSLAHTACAPRRRFWLVAVRRGFSWRTPVSSHVCKSACKSAR